MTSESQLKFMNRKLESIDNNLEEINASLKTIADVMAAEYELRR